MPPILSFPYPSAPLERVAAMPTLKLIGKCAVNRRHRRRLFCPLDRGQGIQRRVNVILCRLRMQIEIRMLTAKPRMLSKSLGTWFLENSYATNV